METEDCPLDGLDDESSLEICKVPKTPSARLNNISMLGSLRSHQTPFKDPNGDQIVLSELMKLRKENKSLKSHIKNITGLYSQIGDKVQILIGQINEIETKF